MGQAVAKLQPRRFHNSDAHRDSSIHSCRSVHPEEFQEDLAVLDHIIVEENESEGAEAAIAAAREYLDSGQLSGPEEAALVLKIAEARRQKGGQQQTSADKIASEEVPPKLDKSSDSKRPVEAAESLGIVRNSVASLKDGVDQGKDNRASNGLFSAYLLHLVTYFKRMRGGVDRTSKVPKPLDMALGWLGAFSSILVIAVLKKWATPNSHFDFLVASFGASAVLVFGASEGKLSQPRNLVGGQVVSAIVGCVVRLIFKDVIWLSSALGMAFALLAMQVTKTLHPPGGATALIAASATDPLPLGSGFSIVLVVLIDALVMLVIGLLVNNAQSGKRYPTYWW